MEGNNQSPMRLLQAAAYIVVVAWGIRAASHILSIIFIALLFAYVILPFPRWLMRRFRFRKSLALVLTVAFVAAIYLVVSAALVEAAFHMREKLPLYEEHIRTLHERLAGLLTAHGILSAHASPGSLYSSGHIIELVRLALPDGHHPCLRPVPHLAALDHPPCRNGRSRGSGNWRAGAPPGLLRW